MSRIGKKPIEVPSGVSININGNNVEVKGPKGALSLEVKDPITVTVEGPVLTVKRPNDSRQVRASHGLYRSLLSNMVEGVSKGYEKKLLLVGVGYRANPQGKAISLSLGHSHPIVVEPPAGIEFEVSKSLTEIIVKGVDKQLVGQVAANIRQFRKVEPYKGKGVRYDGERVIKKAGKSVAAGK